MRNDGMGEVTGLTQARGSIRGTSAIVDGSRLAKALYPLDSKRADEAAKGLGLVDPDFGTLVAGGVVKANDEADKGEHFLVRAESGLLVDRTLEVRDAIREGGTLGREAVDAIFAEINRAGAAADAGDESEGYGGSANARKPLHVLVAELGGVGEKAARGYVRAWKENDLLPTKKKKKDRTFILGARNPFFAVERGRDSLHLRSTRSTTGCGGAARL
jgi:hypothetical protein